jgi:hypothetical protein
MLSGSTTQGSLRQLTSEASRLESFQVVFHAGRGATADENVAQDGILRYTSAILRADRRTPVACIHITGMTLKEESGTMRTISVPTRARILNTLLRQAQDTSWILKAPDGRQFVLAALVN